MEQRKQGDRALFTIEFTSSDEYTDEDVPVQVAEPRRNEKPRPAISQPVKVTTTTFHGTLEEIPEASEVRENPPKEQINEEEINEDVFMLKDSPTTSPVKPAPQPVLTRKLVAIPKKIVTSPTYVVMREKRGLGKSLLFTLREGKTVHFNAKAKKSSVRIWAAGKDANANPDYAMAISNDEKEFSLMKSSAASEEIMLVRYTSAKLPVDNARKVSVFFNVVKDGSPTRLSSRNPKLNPDGKAQHDFGGRFAIDSIKNAILVGTTDGPPLVMIRKAGKDVLEIDVKFPHEVLWMFAIGISSFLSKTH